MSKRFLYWLLTGIVFTIVPFIAFLYLTAINVDCDQFACIGYVILFGPMFLLGVIIIIIVLIAGIVAAAGKQSKKNIHESFN